MKTLHLDLSSDFLLSGMTPWPENACFHEEMASAVSPLPRFTTSITSAQKVVILSRNSSSSLHLLELWQSTITKLATDEASETSETAVLSRLLRVGRKIVSLTPESMEYLMMTPLGTAFLSTGIASFYKHPVLRNE
jgi:hypothetical protein